MGKCSGRKVKCFTCGKMGHFRGSVACKVQKVEVKAVLGDNKGDESDTDSDAW